MTSLRLRGSVFTEPLPRSGLHNPVVPLLHAFIEPLSDSALTYHNNNRRLMLLKLSHFELLNCLLRGRVNCEIRKPLVTHNVEN
jgi:hypothetical protein